VGVEPITLRDETSSPYNYTSDRLWDFYEKLDKVYKETCGEVVVDLAFHWANID
jgi:hypothetical protein